MSRNPNARVWDGYLHNRNMEVDVYEPDVWDMLDEDYDNIQFAMDVLGIDIDELDEKYDVIEEYLAISDMEREVGLGLSLTEADLAFADEYTEGLEM